MGNLIKVALVEIDIKKQYQELTKISFKKNLKINNMKNQFNSKLKIFTILISLTFLSCEVDDSSFDSVEDSNDLYEGQTISGKAVGETVELKNIQGLCPNTKDAQIFEGSREFAGPVQVNTLIKLFIDRCGPQDQIKADIKLYLKGFQSGTKLKQSWVKTVYSAPIGKRIGSILDRPTGKFQEYAIGYTYQDLNLANRFTFFDDILPEAGSEWPFSCNDGPSYNVRNKHWFVKRLDIIGDTGKEDVSNDINCSCDSKITNIEFKDIYIVLEEPYEYVSRYDYKVQNRWRKNYLQDNGFNAFTGNFANSSDWKFERVGNSKYYRIKSKTHNTFLHARYGKPEMHDGTISMGSLDHWELEPIQIMEGTCKKTYFRIKSSNGYYLHTEYGGLGLKRNVPRGWYSAMWCIYYNFIII